MVKLWIKKLTAVLVTFMALGMYIPPTYLDAEAENDEIITEKAENDSDLSTSPVSDLEEAEIDADYLEQTNQYIINSMRELAKEQAVTKMGPRILQEVEHEFQNEILPNIEEVVNVILQEAEEDLPYYGISEKPAAGYGEKIFHLYDYRTKKDVARFHVRRENRPGEGYWFNFHYHLSADNFEEHRLIGEIYWDKNTPPKWMA